MAGSESSCAAALTPRYMAGTSYVPDSARYARPGGLKLTKRSIDPAREDQRMLGWPVPEKSAAMTPDDPCSSGTLDQNVFIVTASVTWRVSSAVLSPSLAHTSCLLQSPRRSATRTKFAP